MHSLQDFDPDGTANSEALFGLPHTADDAAVCVVPVPWEGTVSYGAGTATAPAGILRASWQVDLHHEVFGDTPWQRGLALEEPDPRFAQSWQAVGLPRTPATIDPISRAIDDMVHTRVASILDRGAIPAVLGGEHSVALGGIQAAAARHPGLGILQIDAHADLRVAYEGFDRSHASVMHNALQATTIPRLVAVGLRDLGRAERQRIRDDDRVRAWFDTDIARTLDHGTSWQEHCDRIVADLPPQVWVSFDVDGLDPSLCPHTGTPVPGGLSWFAAITLLRALVASGRHIIGFDLCEVGDGAWDANVGARLLYELAACAIASQPPTGAPHVGS